MRLESRVALVVLLILVPLVVPLGDGLLCYSVHRHATDGNARTCVDIDDLHHYSTLCNVLQILKKRLKIRRPLPVVGVQVPLRAPTKTARALPSQASSRVPGVEDSARSLYGCGHGRDARPTDKLVGSGASLFALELFFAPSDGPP